MGKSFPWPSIDVYCYGDDVDALKFGKRKAAASPNVVRARS